MTDFRIEEDLLGKGYRNITGIDEAGRGALFGPVVAVSVMFSDEFIREKKADWIPDVDDSKLLAPKKREKLAKAILSSAKAVGIGMATNREIDRGNIHWASFEAMRRSVGKMPLSPDFLIVDGYSLPDVTYDQMGLHQGDRKSFSVAAASIIAKVLRDRMMERLDAVYQGYALMKHKGYGTKQHFQALDENGPTVFHRFSFRPISQAKK